MRRLAALALPLLVLAGCGNADPGPPTGGAVPHAGKPSALDPGAGVLGCLLAARIPAKRVSPQVIQVGTPTEAMKVFVARTEGEALTLQVRGEAEGAELVNRLLFYPGRGPEGEVDAIEGCVNAHSTDGT